MNPRTAQTTRKLDFNEQLAVEAKNEGMATLLFAPNRLLDVSKVKAEQKNGTDFMLEPLNSDGSFGAEIRCENKFETYSGGRLTLEAVSVDYNLTPGWMFTSKTAWLLSWFPKSGDLIALPMDALRDLVMPNWARHQSTTAYNRNYLSWSALEDINYLLSSLENARALDLRYEIGATPDEPTQVKGAGREKLCTAEELTALMRTQPRESTPRPVTRDELVAVMRKLAPVNRKGKQADHAARIKALPWNL